MAIPAPHPDLERRREAFIRMKALFDALAAQHPQVDTLSMGMSEDIELAVAEGATMVRVGTAMFGARSRESGIGIRESCKRISGCRGSTRNRAIPADALPFTVHPHCPRLPTTTPQTPESQTPNHAPKPTTQRAPT